MNEPSALVAASPRLLVSQLSLTSDLTQARNLRLRAFGNGNGTLRSLPSHPLIDAGHMHARTECDKSFTCSDALANIMLVFFVI